MMSGTAERTGHYGLQATKPRERRGSVSFNGRVIVGCDQCHAEGYLYAYGERWLCKLCAEEGC